MLWFNVALYVRKAHYTNTTANKPLKKYKKSIDTHAGYLDTRGRFEGLCICVMKATTKGHGNEEVKDKGDCWRAGYDGRDFNGKRMCNTDADTQPS